MFEYKFCKFFKSYLSEDALYSFSNCMIGESKYCSDAIKKHFNKKLSMTKKDATDFENFSKLWIRDNDYVKGDFKVKDHCHITGKYKGSAHRDRKVNVKLNHEISVVFQNLKNYNSHLIMQELGKFCFKLKVAPNGL